MAADAIQPRRGRPRTGDKRSAILAAARALLAERGYDAASVPEIVKRAGVAQGTFYRYFDGKSQLVDALTHAVEQELGAAVTTVLTRHGPTRPIADLIGDLITAALTVVASHADIYPFLDSEALLFGRSPAAEHERARYISALAELISRDQSRGLVAADVDPHVAAGFIGSVLDRTARDVLEKSTEAHQQAVINQAIGFIGRGLAAASTTRARRVTPKPGKTR